MTDPNISFDATALLAKLAGEAISSLTDADWLAPQTSGAVVHRLLVRRSPDGSPVVERIPVRDAFRRADP